MNKRNSIPLASSTPHISKVFSIHSIRYLDAIHYLIRSDEVLSLLSQKRPVDDGGLLISVIPTWTTFCPISLMTTSNCCHWGWHRLSSLDLIPSRAQSKRRRCVLIVDEIDGTPNNALTLLQRSSETERISFHCSSNCTHTKLEISFTGNHNLVIGT